MHFYATLNEKNRVDGFAQSAKPISVPNYIDISDSEIHPSFGDAYENGEWFAVPSEPEPAPQPTLEEMLADIALNLEYSICLAETNMGMA